MLAQKQVGRRGGHASTEVGRAEWRSCWYRSSYGRVEVMLVKEQVGQMEVMLVQEQLDQSSGHVGTERGQSGSHDGTKTSRAEWRSCWYRTR